MEPIPLPSYVHYELLLQLLERQTLPAAKSAYAGQVQQLIVSLRKALAQQRQLEDYLQQAQIPVDFRWSMHEENAKTTQPLH